MFTASMIVAGALIYFVLLASTLAYVAHLTRAGDRRERALQDHAPEFGTPSRDQDARRAA